ncbi:MAG TPA: phosphoglycerate dehydrogenase [Abditibacteriaceae bacterium]|jgi:D-3-phosphoglycerate dehydrogenase
MPRVLICDAISDDGLKILRESAEVDVKTGLSEAELVEIAPNYEAMMVRSATKITRPILEAATKLQIVGRAGVGIDNIDVTAATERGVIVVNSPAGNTVAVAELTLGMMLSLVRKLGPAGASMKAGDWKRSKFMGTEIYGKTLGVIGTGKIGTEVIKRAQAFGMNVLGFDPFLTTQRAQQLNIEACEVDDICERADFITLHTPLTKDTKHLINAARLAKMKPTTVVINCSRGGIIDETALYEALSNGKLGGAGLDVFEVEPPKDTPLRELDNVLLTPHLGASTEEAQVEVAVDVARQIREVFAGRAPQSAVNLPPVPPEAREFLAPFLPLAEKLGRAQAQIADGRIESVELKFCGELSEYDTSSLTRVFLKGLLQPSFDTPVTYVNAPMLAQQRGVGITESKSARSDDYANLIETRVVRNDDGHERAREIDGTVFERVPHIVAIQGLRVDVVPEGTLLVIPNTDRPGMVGRVGTLLGDAAINIVGMQVGRKERGERAVMVLSLDEAVPQSTLEQLDAMEDLFGARQIDMS